MGGAAPEASLDPMRVLALAAHDLKNPVSGILSGAEYLIEDASGVLEPEHLAVLQSIELSSRQMLALIEELSEIAAILPGAMKLDASPCDLGRLVQEIVAEVRLSAALKQVRILWRSNREPVRTEVDVPRMRQAIRAMIRSAVTAAPRGSRIAMRVGGAAGNAAISVRWSSSPAALHRTLSFLLVERIADAHGGALEFPGGRSGGKLLRVLLPLAGRPGPRLR